MARYHIKKDGTPGICHAQPGKCPLGGEGQHYPSIELAQQAADLRNAQNLFTSSKPTTEHEITSEQTKSNLNDLASRNDKIADNSEHVLGGRTSDNYPVLVARSAGMNDLIKGSHAAQMLLNGEGTPIEQLHNGIQEVSKVKLTDNLSENNVKDIALQGWKYATRDNIKAFAGIGGLVSKDNYDDKTLSEMGELELPDNKRGEMSSNQYASAYREITNSAYHGQQNMLNGLVNSERVLDNQYVTVGELRSKINADSKSDNDKHSTLGAYAFARKYATAKEHLNEDQIQKISEKEGIVKHVQKYVGINERDTNAVNLTQDVLTHSLGVNPKDYGDHARIKGTKHKAISEYAFSTPVDKYDKSKVEKAYKYLGNGDVGPRFSTDNSGANVVVHDNGNMTTSIQGVRDILNS